MSSDFKFRASPSRAFDIRMEIGFQIRMVRLRFYKGPWILWRANARHDRAAARLQSRRGGSRFPGERSGSIWGRSMPA